MHPHPVRHLVLALAVLCGLAMVLLAGAQALGLALTPAVALALVAASGALFAALHYVHDAVRTARWNAGGRVG